MANSRRNRIDKHLVENGFCESRERAQRLILAGQVYVNEQIVDKPGALVHTNSQVRLATSERYVGRGGYKLEAALDHFGIEVSGRVCLDIGASTGGFTDCLLQRGAKAVIALDVGHDQLAWKIRSDPRVKVYEHFNARNLEPSKIGGKIQLAVIDVSFISLTLVLEPAFSCVETESFVVVLIKPQFELAPEKVGKGGIIRNEHDRNDVVAKIQNYVTGTLAREWIGCIESPILGAKGNKEFLACLR